MPKLALYVPLKAKPGKERDVTDFLTSALPLVQAEPGTLTWYAIEEGPGAYAIFDTFDTEEDRQAHLDGKVAAALMDKAEELFSEPPQIHKFTLLAAKEAVAQAGLEFQGELGLCSGVVLGTAGGGLNTWDENYRIVYEEGKNRVHPFVVPKLMNNAAASHVSMEFGLRGPAFTVATACASST